MRFTAADPWVTYFPLLRRVKCVLAYCFFFSVLLFKCMDKHRHPPHVLKYMQHVVTSYLARLQNIHSLKFFSFNKPIICQHIYVFLFKRQMVKLISFPTRGCGEYKFWDVILCPKKTSGARHVKLIKNKSTKRQ